MLESAQQPLVGFTLISFQNVTIKKRTVSPDGPFPPVSPLITSSGCNQRDFNITA